MKTYDTIIKFLEDCPQAKPPKFVKMIEGETLVDYILKEGKYIKA